MDICYFLGANTRSGFRSLYDGFCSGPDDYLYIIKGGPGGGKSSFMRKIGEAASRRGYDVEYVVCSGDPDSLDGVYIPQKHVGFVDGTAPHVIEPRNIGADSFYVNLGCFCSCEIAWYDARRITELTAEYRAHYARAYKWLGAAGCVAEAPIAGAYTPEALEKARSRAASSVRREAHGIHRTHRTGRVTKRFLSAISGSGDVELYCGLNEAYTHIYGLDNRLGLAVPYLEAAMAEAGELGIDVIFCPCPLNPETPEAILLPELGVMFTTKFTGEPYRHVRLDALGDIGGVRRELRQKEAIYGALMGEARSALADAKLAHDALEGVYRPYMNFEGLTRYTLDTIEALFV